MLVYEIMAWRRRPSNVISFGSSAPLDPIDLHYLRAELAARNLSTEGELTSPLVLKNPRQRHPSPFKALKAMAITEPKPTQDGRS